MDLTKLRKFDTWAEAFNFWIDNRAESPEYDGLCWVETSQPNGLMMQTKRLHH